MGGVLLEPAKSESEPKSGCHLNVYTQIQTAGNMGTQTRPFFSHDVKSIFKHYFARDHKFFNII